MQEGGESIMEFAFMPSKGKHGPTDVIAQGLIIKDKVLDPSRKLFTLPFAFTAGSFLSGGFSCGRPGGLYRIGCRT